MNKPVEPQHTRREICRDALRYVALGGIVLLSAGLVGKGVGRSGTTQCPLEAAAVQRLPQTRVACLGCAALADCNRPQAAAARTSKEH